jgi:hypothetical protein
LRTMQIGGAFTSGTSIGQGLSGKDMWTGRQLSPLERGVNLTLGAAGSLVDLGTAGLTPKNAGQSFPTLTNALEGVSAPQVTRTGGRLGVSTEGGSIRVGRNPDEIPKGAGKGEAEVINPKGTNAETVDFRKRTDAQLKEDVKKTPRTGETEIQMRQRIEAASKETAQRLERADGGHSLDRHGPNVTPEQLDKRLKTGVAPDGVVSFAPASTRFNSNENWLQTRQGAVETLRTKHGNLVGDDLRKPPGPNQPRSLAVKVRYDKPIDDGFVPDQATKSRVTIPVDAAGKPTTPTSGGRTKTGDVFTRTNPIEDVTGAYTNFAWDAAEGRWKIVQHYPFTKGWDNASKTYSHSSVFDAEIELP